MYLIMKSILQDIFLRPILSLIIRKHVCTIWQLTVESRQLLNEAHSQNTTLEEHDRLEEQAYTLQHKARKLEYRIFNLNSYLS